MHYNVDGEADDATAGAAGAACHTGDLPMHARAHRTGSILGRRPGRRVAAVALLAVTTVFGTAIAADYPTTRKAGGAAIIPIRGTISDVMRDSVRRRLDEAYAAGVKTIIFEMDTPGGLVTSALDICRIIKNVPQDVRTVAWVHPEAYSAGAMISVACNEIWMSPASSIGDCAPIMVAPTGAPVELGETERAKSESPILQEFRDSATRNGYNPLLSRAMVTVGEEVWWVEKADDPNERRFVSTAEKQKLIDEPTAENRVWRLVEHANVPGADKRIDIQQPVDRSDTLLTMSQYDAVIFGFAKGIAVDTADLTLKLELPGAPMRFEKSGWESFAAWLNSPLIRGLLMVIVLVGAYAEFQHPGMVLPGAAALIALAVFLAAPYAAGLASIWTIVVLVIGLALLAIEVFVIPGFGFVGLLGIALVAIALIGTFVPSEPNAPPFALPTLPGTWDGLVLGLKVMTVSLCISLVGIFLLVTYLPRTRVVRGVATDNPVAAALALGDPSVGVAEIGDVGVVVGDLKPAGNARFGQDVVEVQSQGEYVEIGRRVQVIRREGMRVVVRPLTDERPA